MNGNPAQDQSWPKTAAGTADWEVVFEDPDTGLLALVGQASSPAALRECAILIIARLYARKDDPEEVARFTWEISVLIPDHLGSEDLAGITQAVTILLRKIKDFRIQKAAEHEAALAAAEGDAGGAPALGEATQSGRDRRKSDSLAAIRLPAAETKKSKRPLI
jgi:hypothetical protein